jgi:hypothetical protein
MLATAAASRWSSPSTGTSGTSPISRLLQIALLALAALAAASLAGPGTTATGRTLAPRLTIVKPGSVGEIEIGDTIRSLHRRNLIGALRPGCELDPGQRFAHLRPPLKGVAIFFHGGKRLSSIVVEGGAESAAGIRVGSTVREAREAYPKAEYDPPGSMEPFVEGFLWVNRASNPRMTFLIEPRSKLVLSISVPSVNFCE